MKGLTAGSASTYIFGAGYLSYVLFLSLNVPRGNDSIEHVALNEFIYPQHLEPGISEHSINATIITIKVPPAPKTEKAMALHSSTPAWKIPWTKEPGRLQSLGSLRVRTRLSDFTFTFHFHASEKEMATHSSVLAWRIPGTGEPDGLPSMGSHRVRHD